MRYISPWIGLFASLTVAVAAMANDTPTIQPLTADQVRAELEGIASRLHFFSAEQFLYGGMLTTHFDKQDYPRMREGPLKPIAEMVAFINADVQTIRPIFWPEYKPETLIPLLKHDDPKVRTLAAAALVVIDPIRHVPVIEPLLDDSAATFPSLTYFDYNRPSLPKPQTVADVISELARPVDADWVQRIDAWRVATGRRFTCSELLRQLNRAENAHKCYPEESKKRIDAIKSEITQLPMPDRVWYQIAMARRPKYETGRRPSGFDLEAEGNLVGLAAQLSHDQIMGALRRHLDTLDPSVQSPGIKEVAVNSRAVPSISDSIRRFILDHADRLLEPSDVEFLLMREWVEPDFTGLRSPIWAIAAARVEPHRARDFLLPALDRWSLELQERERHSIVIALRELSEETPVEFFVDWFYGQPCSNYSDAETLVRFLRQISQMRDPDGGIIIAAIVRDSRFDESPPQIVEEIHHIFEERLRRDFHVKDKSEQLKTPLGISDFWWKKADATARHSARAKAFFDTMAHWRAQLRECLDEYSARTP